MIILIAILVTRDTVLSENRLFLQLSFNFFVPLEPNAHNSGNFMRVADMKIDDSGNPSLQANTNRERHSVELQVINEAMSATYYDVTV